MKSQLVPHGATKFRENSADSVTFHLAEHTAALPSIVTISRTLPTPRKGNAGTMKIFVNFRKSILINSGLADEKIVLQISKLETSIPVGISAAAARVNVRDSLLGFITTDSNPDNTTAGRDQSLEDMLVTGILPDQHGDPTV